jgi:hypothetical protein
MPIKKNSGLYLKFDCLAKIFTEVFMKNLFALSVALIVMVTTGCGKHGSGGGDTGSATGGDTGSATGGATATPFEDHLVAGTGETGAENDAVPAPPGSPTPDPQGSVPFILESRLPSRIGNAENIEKIGIVHVTGLTSGDTKSFTKEDFLKTVQGLCDKSATAVGTVIPETDGLTTVKWTSEASSAGAGGNFSMLITQSKRNGAQRVFCDAN